MNSLFAWLLFWHLAGTPPVERPVAILPSIPQVPVPYWFDRDNRRARRRAAALRRQTIA